MIIVYESGDEILICTPLSEPELVQTWFTEGDRDLENFDRNVLEGSSAILGITRGYLRIDSNGVKVS